MRNLAKRSDILQNASFEFYNHTIWEKRGKGSCSTKRKYIYIKYKNINIYNKYIFFLYKISKIKKKYIYNINSKNKCI